MRFPDLLILKSAGNIIVSDARKSIILTRSADLKEYMNELDILYGMQKKGSRMTRKKDLLFVFVKSDSVTIDVQTLKTTADSLPRNIEEDENILHDH